MAKLNMAYLSSLKKPSKTAVVLIAGVTISGTPCPRHFIVPFGAEAPSGHVAQAWAIPPPSWDLLSQWHRQQTNNARRRTKRPPPEPSDILKRFHALYDNKLRYYMKKVSKSNWYYYSKKNEIFVGSSFSKFLRPAQRYDDFKLIRITCQAACHGKTEHGIFVKFKKPSKTAVVLIAGVTISGTPCPRHFIVPIGAEAPSGHVAQAWAIPTSFLRPALPMAPTTDNNARDERNVLRPNPATFLRDFTLHMTTNYAIIWKRCLNYTAIMIQKNEIFVGSRISKFLRPAQRYDDFKLIRITCQAACHGKTEHGIFVKV